MSVIVSFMGDEIE